MRIGLTKCRALCLLLLFAAAQVDAGGSGCERIGGQGYTTFSQTDDRLHDQQHCFAAEYQAIIDRRAQNGSTKSSSDGKPGALVGLGLSGGGIKSSAFQLGLLSGLHASKMDADRRLLDEIDYVSSVSGGSWANGAYIGSRLSDDEFFSCLDRLVARDETIQQCNCIAVTGLIPSRQSKVWGSEAWQHQIIENYLPWGNQTLEEVRACGVLRDRPMPVFLATHSNTILGNKTVNNFPFEITPFSIGTAADCNSNGGEGMGCGFSRRYLRLMNLASPPQQGFQIALSQLGAGGTEGVNLEVKKYLPVGDADLRLSHGMWASGALVAKVFSLHLRISKGEQPLPGVREKYVLSDGGKADNVGLIPLVERGVDLVILSQIASDSDRKCGDISRAAEQGDRLFKVKVDADSLKSQLDCAEEKSGTLREFPLIASACIKTEGRRNGAVWLIKPIPENVTDFYSWLDKSGKYSHVLEYLNDRDRRSDKPTRFPQNQTVELDYDQDLMFSYYLLGKYIAEHALSTKLRAWLNDPSECQGS